MIEPNDHAQRRNPLEDLLRRIPGFRGYLEKEYRRDSDALARQHLADQLDRAKREGIDGCVRRLADRGEIDNIDLAERFRARIDQFITRVRSAMQGYSGVFDLVQIDEAVLERVYDFDRTLADDVQSLAQAVAELRVSDSPPAEAIPPLSDRLLALERTWERRAEILKGLAT